MERQTRIGGSGVKIAVLGQFPWHVRLVGFRTGKTLVCSGVLISDQWLLTAAHCRFA